MEQEFLHLPVMLKEVVEYLNIKEDGTYLDATVGGAGHSKEILKYLKNGKLYCIDKDPDALTEARKKLEKYKNVDIIEGDFRDIKSLVPSDITFDGALLDLGVSSYQLDSPERGFSYTKESMLDMRMSKKGVSAKDIVNEYSEEELTQIIYRYGQERYAGYISRKIVAARQIRPIDTTIQLAAIVTSALPPDVRRKDKNPARKTFMALRIEANDELDALKEGIDNIFDMLNSNGRLLIITFHSLEDRIVKQRFAELSKGCICPPDFPICVCGNVQRAKTIGRKPIQVSEEEAIQNKRARSAKLRILGKI